MYQDSLEKFDRYRRFQADGLAAARRLGNGVFQRGRQGQSGRGGRLGPLGGFGHRGDHRPVITVLVPWTPEFGMAYQQFVNGGMGGMGGYPMGGMGGYPMGGMGGYPMGGMGGYPMGGMGGSPMGGFGGYGGGLQGVPIGFGVTTS